MSNVLQLGTLLYDDNGNTAHVSNQWNSTDYEIACCGDDSQCKPTPPKPPVYHHPWVRFAHVRFSLSLSRSLSLSLCLSFVRLLSSNNVPDLLRVATFHWHYNDIDRRSLWRTRWTAW